MTDALSLASTNLVACVGAYIPFPTLSTMNKLLLLRVNVFLMTSFFVEQVASFSPSTSLHSPSVGGRSSSRQLPLCSSSSSTTPTTSSSNVIDSEAWKTEISQELLVQLQETAERAARAAGAIIRAHQGCCASSSSSQDECEIKFNIKDVVTQYDKQAQDVMERIIRTEFPTHSFLGEEEVASGAAASETALVDILQQAYTKSNGCLWISDPIDATANFRSGLKLSATTIGVVYKGVPIVGVTYDPNQEELFAAIRGKGATLNGIPIQVSQSTCQAQDAIINAGCPADPNAFDASMRGVLALNSKSRGIRMIACSALTTAWIASGRLTAHFGYDLSSWDLVAGALLIQEAGGTVTDLDGTPYRLQTRNMLCSNGLVHEEVLDILQKANATSFVRSTQ